MVEKQVLLLTYLRFDSKLSFDFKVVSQKNSRTLTVNRPVELIGDFLMSAAPEMDDRKRKIDEATAYLATGGLGEVIGMTDATLSMGLPKVQMDTEMAMALCILANETLVRRASH